jgi:hypothetical protein
MDLIASELGYVSADWLSSVSGDGEVTDSCGHSKELSGFINTINFLTS